MHALEDRCAPIRKLCGVPAPIPVVLLTGFLGAGKTSLLNHLLQQRRARIGVVVNDFGSVNIDAMLVAGQVDAAISLGNGCLCCAVDTDDLDLLFERLSQPRLGIDVIVVEASGLAEPGVLARMVLGSSNPRIGYSGLVQVVDAAEFGATRDRHPELIRHLRLADLVVLNKADLLTADDVATVRAELAEIAGAVPVYPTTHGRLDPELLFDRVDRAPAAGQLSFDDLLAPDQHAHLHDGYRAVTVTTGRLDPRAFIALLERPPAGLFRAKGQVVFAVAGEPCAFTVQLVGSHLRCTPERRVPGETTLVFIGIDLDADALRAAVESTVHHDDPLGEDALLPVWRYVEH